MQQENMREEEVGGIIGEEASGAAADAHGRAGYR